MAPTCGYEAKFDPASTKESLFQGSKQRLECGAPGISFDECTNLGCCYDDTMTTFIDAVVWEGAKVYKFFRPTE